MYPKVPPMEIHRSSRVTSSIQLHAVMPGIVMANTIPSTVLIALWLIIAIK